MIQPFENLDMEGVSKSTTTLQSEYLRRRLRFAGKASTVQDRFDCIRTKTDVDVIYFVYMPA